MPQRISYLPPISFNQHLLNFGASLPFACKLLAAKTDHSCWSPSCEITPTCWRELAQRLSQTALSGGQPNPLQNNITQECQRW